MLTLVLAVRVEWAKTYARVKRFSEEQELVLEEMRRVRRYFVWRSQWWVARSRTGCPDVPELVQIGRESYARKQAHLIEQLSLKFERMWRSLLPSLNLPTSLLEV